MLNRKNYGEAKRNGNNETYGGLDQIAVQSNEKWVRTYDSKSATACTKCEKRCPGSRRLKRCGDDRRK